MHPRFAYRLVDVFTRRRFAGNPLAVFSDARGLSPEAMQRFAFELHLSEATFVLPAQRGDCDVRVRIFTPRRELPMAGHPAVGTAFALEQDGVIGARVCFELGVGPTPLERVPGPDGGPIWRMEQPLPRFDPGAPDAAAVAHALGLEASDLAGDVPLAAAATGLPFLMVALRSLDALGRARLRTDAWAGLGPPAAAWMPYLFVRTGADATGADTVRARMFAPGEGIAEDPATGSAAGPLGAFLVEHGALRPDPTGHARLTVTQGVEMGRPSELFVEIEGRPGQFRAVRVGGAAVTVGGGWLVE
ncbi:PhzF family phenazine biosynthesis protein [Myxococcota bacterium]|nr:PhzF family phenazine biosynthesis protein [Myxococcota bacterium]